jgi:hypothetical protein
VPALAIAATWPQPVVLWYKARLRFASPERRDALLEEIIAGEERWKTPVRLALFDLPPESVAITATAVMRGDLFEASFMLRNVGRGALRLANPVIVDPSVENGNGEFPTYTVPTLEPGEALTIRNALHLNEDHYADIWVHWSPADFVRTKSMSGGTRFVFFPRGEPPRFLSSPNGSGDPPPIAVAIAPADAP